MSFMSRASACFSVALVGFAAFAASTACTSFRADSAVDGGPSAETGPVMDAAAAETGPSACPVESCEDAGPSCRSERFDAGCPTSNFAFTGDQPGVAGIVGECTAGRLHVVAANGMGVAAVFEGTTPTALRAIHVSARIAATAWDPGPVFTVSVDAVTVAEIRAEGSPTGNPVFRFCAANGVCGSTSFTSAVGVEHVFTLDITSSAALVGIDCLPFATVASPIQIAPDKSLLLSFGKTNAIGIDGTLDDLLVSFR